MRRGLALILVVGVLAVLAVLGSAFAVLSRLERKAAALRVQSTQALLLARSGIEDAAARLGMGQDPAYGGEDWDGDGSLDAAPVQEDVRADGILDATCPLRLALRPSWFVRDPSVGGYPALFQGRGRSGGFDERRTWALKVEDLNARIHVNGGSGSDVTMSGPNGFLVRLLDNLDLVITGTSGLGTQVVSARPPAGYARVEDLKAVLSPARYDRFRSLVTTEAWVDPKVVKPQLVDARPNRWLDVDEKHKSGDNNMDPISGVAPVGPVLGTGTSEDPWRQNLQTVNRIEGTVTYPVVWERSYLYAWRQLRLAPPAFEPRAPLSINTATTEVLAAAFLGLKGVYLEVWEGSAGWDGGFGFINTDPHPKPAPPAPLPPTPTSVYPYPSQATEDTPWIRTRLDYGMGYGLPGRSWYAPPNYDPTATSNGWDEGKPLVQCAPLGRLRECDPISAAQARALAEAIRQQGPFRTWTRFHAFVDALPAWEEPDGAAYTVSGSAGTYSRRIYRRGDADSDGILDQESFPGGARGLTFVQKDLIKAMANPNTDLNDFNPDANLWKEIDKTDIGGIGSSRVSSAWQDDPEAYAHTTELSLDLPPVAGVRAIGRSQSASRSLGARLDSRVHRDTTQADLMQDAVLEGGWSGPAPYPLSGEKCLVGYPEPPSLPAASYDGQVSLGFIGPEDVFTPTEVAVEPLRGDLFDTLDAPATGKTSTSDVRGPFREPLVRPAGSEVGNLFPDGAYSEKDASLKFNAIGGVTAAWAFWVKPNWFPEASPRAHALLSLSPWHTNSGFLLDNNVRIYINSFGTCGNTVPLDDILMRPFGLYFVPARNNAMQGPLVGSYVHNASSTRGATWPSRSLLWGTTHAPFFSESMNRKGNETASPAPKPVGRLEAHRWQHLVALSSGDMLAFNQYGGTPNYCPVYAMAGKHYIDPTGMGGNWQMAILFMTNLVRHQDGSRNHMRFGEIAACHTMNYTADATFANVSCSTEPAQVGIHYYRGEWGNCPAVLGRHFKEPRAAFRSAPLPSGLRAQRVTWTEIPCTVRFDRDSDAWLDAAEEDDLDGDGLRDVRIDLEIHDDLGLLTRFSDPGALNRVPGSRSGPLRYKAVFVNDWDANTRASFPLDVTPFLDDVTFVGRVSVLAWEEGDEG